MAASGGYGEGASSEGEMLGRCCFVPVHLSSVVRNAVIMYSTECAFGTDRDNPCAC